MTTPPQEPTAPGPGLIEWARISVARAGLFVVTALLAAGLLLWPLGYLEASTETLQLATIVLVVMPITGVLALLFEEIRRRDWVFVGAAVLVIAMLGVSLYRLWSGDHPA